MITELGKLIADCQGRLHELENMSVIDIPQSAIFVFIGRKLIADEAEKAASMSKEDLACFIRRSERYLLAPMMDLRDAPSPKLRGYGRVLTDADIELPETHTAFGIGFGLIMDRKGKVWNLSLLK